MADRLHLFGNTGGSPTFGSKELPEDDRRIERALMWILGVLLFGFVLIMVIASGQEPPLRWPFFGTATLAALAALAVGVALGLLFGLPIRTATHAVATTTAAATSGSAAGTDAAPGPQPAAASQSWYTDNTSLEQIAQWLTTAIVALTLVNFDGWMDRFETTAKTLTCSMYQQGVQLPIPATGASGRQGDAPVVVLFSPCSVACAPQNAPPPQGARGEAPPQAAAQANCTDASPIPGGVIMAMYALFGFIGAYLWARRYLMGEFSRGQVDQSRIARAELRSLNRAQAVGLIQSGPKNTSSQGQLAALTETLVSEDDPMSGVGLVEPGAQKNDPWKLQFGGEPTNKQVTMSATVTELVSRPGLYQVNMEVRPSDNSAGAQLANRPVRIYLHPTFPNPVRTAHFDVSGRLRIPLIAYGAFTVGIQLEDDERAELDLSLLPDAPMQFRLA